MAAKRRLRQRKNNRHMTGEELLHKATGGWKFKTDNTLCGSYAETDFDKKLVRINKKKHTNKRLLARERSYHKNPDGSESMLDSLVHEMVHIADPKAGEKKTVRRAARIARKMSTREKKRVYALVRK